MAQEMEGDSAQFDWASRSHPVKEDMPVQRKSWRFERIGWAFLALLVVAGLSGLLSVGPVSTTTAVGANGQLKVTYSRFERVGAASRVVLEVSPEAGEEVVLRLGQSFLKAFTIESLHPEPSEQRPEAGGAEMVVRAIGARPLRVYLSVRPEQNGLVESEIAIAGAAPARLTQFIFP